MKKQNRQLNIRKLAIVIAIVMSMLCGCATNQGSSQQVTSSAPTKEAEPTKAEVEPTKEAEPTEVVVEEPTKEAEPTPEPTEAVVVEDNPNIIKGFDFTGYNVRGESVWKVFSEIQNDKLMWVVSTSQKGELMMMNDVLFDGDSIEMNMSTQYCCSLYSPKNIIGFGQNGPVKADNMGKEDMDGNKFWSNIYTFSFDPDDDPDTFENQEYKVEVQYDDGSVETITINVTRH